MHRRPQAMNRHRLSRRTPLAFSGLPRKEARQLYAESVVEPLLVSYSASHLRLTIGGKGSQTQGLYHVLFVMCLLNCKLLSRDRKEEEGKSQMPPH